jgi:hypothetical protein
LAEPPSEAGTAGGQIVLDEWLAVAAVEDAACDGVLGLSPESCKGTCEVFDDDAPKPEALLPPAALLPVDPVANDDVGTLSGSELVPMLPVWSLAV